MQINFGVMADYILIILILLPLLMGLKYIIIYTLVKLEDTKRVAFKTAFSLIQIGEFSLAILELGRSQDLVDPTYSQILIVTIVISMILTPIILKNLKKVAGLVISDNVMVAPASYSLDKDLQDHVV